MTKEDFFVMFLFGATFAGPLAIQVGEWDTYARVSFGAMSAVGFLGGLLALRRGPDQEAKEHPKYPKANERPE